MDQNSNKTVFPVPEEKHSVFFHVEFYTAKTEAASNI